MKVVFIAELDVPSEELEKAEDDTMQAIQNMIGHTGASVGSVSSKMMSDRAADLEGALSCISAIRESIVAHQNINWSAHIYPLVAVLNQAGFDTSDVGIEEMKAAYLADSNTVRGIDAYTKLGIVLEERGLLPENNPLLKSNCECAHKRASHRNVVGDTRCEVDGCDCTQMRVRPGR